MQGLLKRLARAALTPFAWRTVKNTGVWKYQVNKITGRRRYRRSNARGYQPLDFHWIHTGEFSDRPRSWPHT